MSEEANQQQQNVETPQELPQDLDKEQSFNLLVNLARQSKLTYDEHALVDKAVRNLSQALDLQV